MEMEKQPVEKRKVYGTIIGVAIFVVFVIGATYAWFTWSSGQTNISGTSGCFEIEYVNGTEITGALAPSADYLGGRSTTATMNIKSTCTTKGTGTIHLTTNPDSTVDMTTGAVKYAVYNGTTPVTGGTGSITGGTQDLVTVDLTKTATTYTIYVWLDASIADDTYIGSSYGGYIHASATQVDGVDNS